MLWPAMWKTGTIAGTTRDFAAISKIRIECLENADVRLNAAFMRLCEGGFVSISSEPGEGRPNASGIGAARGIARSHPDDTGVPQGKAREPLAARAGRGSREGGRSMSDSRINRARGVALEDLDVVVVDDSKPMQTIVRSMLNAARVHRVRTFDNAGDAYRAMLVEPPHLLVTDWNLPDTDGLSLVRSLRDPRSGPLAGVPAILITGHATRNLVEKAIASGIHFVLAKPLSPANVLKRINAVILDERRFEFDHVRGHYVLQGADELLAGQRQRWRELQEGTLRSSRDREEREMAAAKSVAVAPKKAAEPTPATKATVSGRRSAAREAATRRSAFGFGSSIKRVDPVETSTGQSPRQAS